MFHFNVPFPLASVRYLWVAQDLSRLASIQLAWLQLLQSLSLKSLSLAAYSYTVQGQDFGQTSSQQHCEPSNPVKLNEPHAALSNSGKLPTAEKHTRTYTHTRMYTHTHTHTLVEEEWSSSTYILNGLWDLILYWIQRDPLWLHYTGDEIPGKGSSFVLIEYISEEAPDIHWPF